MILRFVKAYIGILSAVVLTISFAFYFLDHHDPNYSGIVQDFNKQFISLEKKLDDALRYVSEDLKVNSMNDEWNNLEKVNPINIHIYRNDSLKFWNTNQLPIIRFAEIHFPSEGITHLQNGWYYSKIKELDGYIICGSFLIKHDFAIENRDLINGFNPALNVPFDAKITIGEEDGEKVFTAKGEYLFSLVPNEEQEISQWDSVLSMLLILAAIIAWLYVAKTLQVKFKNQWKWTVPVAIIILRCSALYWNWFAFMEEHPSFNPVLYGSNFVFPSFFDYLLNIIVVVYLLFQLRSALKAFNRKKIGVYFGVLLLVISFVFWTGILHLAHGLVENSTIPMAIDQLFDLNAYSVFALASLGVVYYYYFQFVVQLIRFLIRQNFSLSRLSVIVFIAGCLFFLYEINYGNKVLFPAMFPMLFYGIALYLASREKQLFKLASGLVLLFLFSSAISTTFNELNEKKELSDRQLYANQLATERSITTEVEYHTISESLSKDNFLKRFVANPPEISVSDFQENLERRYFNTYWERYEIEFNFFDENRLPLVDKQKYTTDKFDELTQTIDESSTPSELNPSIFYVNDYHNQYSYIIRQEIIANDGKKGFLFCTLKSKKIPEEIGFPRLLISQNANVLEPLEAYSIARYLKGNLLTNYGDFNYPSSFAIIDANNVSKAGFVDYGEYNHFVLKKSDNNIVVLSKKNKSSIDFLTAFSYMFCFYGALLLPFLFQSSAIGNQKRTLNLAMKIQVVLVSLVFVALLAFGWGSGIFISNQFNEITDDAIREKLNSVETEVRSKLGEYDNLSIDENGDYMQYILQKFARVFYTDINLYDTDGYLLATSRPKVFNVGLISEQMNPYAFKNIKYGQRSEFVHQENIGKLNYSSAYQPFFNNQGKKLAFINLQHFGQQSAFESQIEKFLVAIINVFVLLLAISIILAIFISNWLTSPLRLLQENVAQIRFGTRNEYISYDKDDEIGALVKEYNLKLEELEYTASELAKSERESAWREMAKQVAHEIKNPLTPMKLSVQQLLRSYDPTDEKSKEKLERVANSIVEQIDALTKIANEFSTFAKMPNPSQEKLEIVSTIKGITEMFENDENSVITFSTTLESAYVNADKDQLIRVFNNLIKNALQAIPSNKDGEIRVKVKSNNDDLLITVSDNGSGIEEAEFSKIFVPYFTTKSTGTGLGLAMVKQIVENHGGSIEFTSAKNEGTTFLVTIPMIKSEA